MMRNTKSTYGNSNSLDATQHLGNHAITKYRANKGTLTGFEKTSHHIMQLGKPYRQLAQFRLKAIVLVTE